MGVINVGPHQVQIVIIMPQNWDNFGVQSKLHTLAPIPLNLALAPLHPKLCATLITNLIINKQT